MGQELDTSDGAPTPALVELLPGTALLFGEVPDGLDLRPLPLALHDQSDALTRIFADSSNTLNVSSQLVSGLAPAQGLVRLAPETVRAMQAGATPLQSGGYNLGALAGQNGKIVAQIRWVPATGVTAVGVVAAVAPALAMMAMKMQMDEITSIAKRNLELTEAVLSTMQHEQWAELTGLEQTVSRALDEADAIGRVTPLLWENVAGSEAALRKQSELYLRHVHRHAAEIAGRKKLSDLRDYLEQHREAILFDVRSLIVAHRSLFQYQLLRLERVKDGAETDSREADLPQAIVKRAQEDYAELTEQTVTLIDALNRELHLVAEVLPRKRNIPFSGGRKDRAAVAQVSEELLDAVDRLSALLGRQSVIPELPETVFGEATDQVEQDLRILRWYLRTDERLQAIATADAPGGIPKMTDTLIAVTDQRVIEARLGDFRKSGSIHRSIPNADVRYVRLRTDRSSEQADLDLITAEENLTWRLAKGSSSSDEVKALGAMLAQRMQIPDEERDALVEAARTAIEA